MLYQYQIIHAILLMQAVGWGEVVVGGGNSEEMCILQDLECNYFIYQKLI